MIRTSRNRFLRNIATIMGCTVAVVVLAITSNAHAANCSITTTPTPAVITEGGSVTFDGSVSGKRPTSITNWSFQGGTPSSVDGDVAQVTVDYASATGSPFTATMNGVDGRSTCSAEVSVTVNPAGGGNCVRSAPTFSMGADQVIALDGSAVYTLSVTNNDTVACPDTTFSIDIDSETGDTGSFNASSLSNASVVVTPGDTDQSVTLAVKGNGSGTDGDALTTTASISDTVGHSGQDQSDSVTTTTCRGHQHTGCAWRRLRNPGRQDPHCCRVPRIGCAVQRFRRYATADRTELYESDKRRNCKCPV